MRGDPHARMRLWLGGLAGAGVAVAHVLAFRVVSPDHAARSDLLHATGHRYWPYVAALALGGLVAGLVGFVADRVSADRRGHPGIRRLYAFTASRLLILQTLGFLYLEAGERLVVDGSFTGLLQEPVVIIGLVVQAAVALVGALLVVLFAQVVDTIVAVLRPVVRPSKVATPRGALRSLGPRLRLATGGATLRGPPALR